MLAKICSDWNKPNGQAYIPPNRDFILDFIGKLPIRKIPNIGGMTETALAELGIKTGLDLREKAVDLMISYREIAHTFFIRCGLGLGQTRHGEADSDENYEQKGISISETFRPLTLKHEFQRKISELAKELAKRMAKEQLAGQIVCLTLKLTTFHSKGRQERQPRYVWKYEEIRNICLKLLECFWPVSNRSLTISQEAHEVLLCNDSV